MKLRLGEQTLRQGLLMAGANQVCEGGAGDDLEKFVPQSEQQEDFESLSTTSEDEDPFKYIVYEDCVNDKKSKLGNLIGFIDYWDRYSSRKFSLIDNAFCNWFFGIFAWLFNRGAVALQLPVLFMWTYLQPELVTAQLGYKCLPGDVNTAACLPVTDNKFKAKLGLFVMIYALICLGMLILFGSVPLKILFGRERPTQIKSVKRICNMREREHGTKSMPSGDATAAAFCCGCYAFLFDFPWLLIFVMPLSCLGRVYVQCHWFGDVAAGAILGSIFVVLTFSVYFEALATPLFKAITGTETPTVPTL